MPVCLRPDKTFKYSLAGDKLIAPAKRPHFLAKYISVEKRFEMVERLRPAPVDGEDSRTAVEKEREADAIKNGIIKDLVSGVSNMGEFTLDTLVPELTAGEKVELIWGILNENEMNEDDLKN